MTTIPPAAPKRRRWLIVIAGFFVLAVSVPFAVPAWLNWRIERELADAIAETDRLDPGWRMEEMRAKREAVPDAENAALHIRKVARLLPDKSYYPQFRDLALPEGMTIKSSQHRDWIADIYYSVDDTSDNRQLSMLQIEALASEWKQHRQAIKEACKLCEYTKCRFHDTTYAAKVDGMQSSRAVGELLRVAFLHHCQAEADEDVHAILRALIKLTQCQNDELNVSMQLCRMGSLHTTCQLIRRMLGQGESRPEALTEIQAGLKDCENTLVLSILVRAHRAEWWQLYRDAQEGSDETRRMFTEMLATSRTKQEEEEPAWYLRWFVQKRLPDLREMQAQEMRLANRAVEFARKSVDDQSAAYANLVKEKEVVAPGMRSSPIEALAKAVFRTTTQLRTTRTAIAVERYRFANDQWPKTLDQLVPAYLAEMPLDLYAGKPMMYRHVDHGVVVYSVGEDRNDNHGKVRPDQDTIGFNGLDIGVRLWDVEHRRQPPLPPMTPRAHER